MRLDANDLTALGRVLDQRLAVKKGKDIVVEGYEYIGLDVIETGFAVRYTLLHKGGRQIINTLLPGDIVGFPASVFDRAIFCHGRHEDEPASHLVRSVCRAL